MYDCKVSKYAAYVSEMHIVYNRLYNNCNDELIR